MCRIVVRGDGRRMAWANIRFVLSKFKGWGVLAKYAQSGMLRSHGGPVERATARICREAGARVATNIGVNDVNTNHHHHHHHHHHRHDEGRGRFAGAALQELAEAKKERPKNFSTTNAAGGSCFAIGVGGKWSEEAAAFISNLEIPVGAGLNSNANNNANLIVSSDQPMHSYHQDLHHLSSQRIPCTYPMQPMYLPYAQTLGG